VNERIGAKIKRLRLEKGWSRIQLERESGINQGTIYRVEQGKRPPRTTTVNALISALSRPSKATDGQQGGTTEGSDLGIEDHLGALLAHVKTLAGEDRRSFIRAVTALFDALEHARPSASSGPSKDDDR
jgi:transcriptional regulator with XRE-family HTH domain